nr:MAG TPA: hypothetical protein [Caudoviricetes sp.]
MQATNNINSILEAINDFATNCGLMVNEDNAYEAACYIRDTHYEMWDEEIEIGFGELDKQFNIYRF